MADSKDDLGLTTRRVVLGGVGATGLLGLTGALAACGDDSPATGQAGQQTTTPAVLGTTPVVVASSPGAAPSADAGGGDSNALAKLSDIPVGGGKIFESDNVVVTQPTAGTFKAFSATCTHKSCIVKTVTDGLINCPCHGSQFSIKDGSVVTPARGLAKDAMQPLPAKTVTVTGNDLSVG